MISGIMESIIIAMMKAKSSSIDRRFILVAFNSLIILTSFLSSLIDNGYF
jgi:hypothetical protein